MNEKLVPPPGYRLLQVGERWKATDLVSRDSGTTWGPVCKPGGMYNPQRHYPGARRLVAGNGNDVAQVVMHQRYGCRACRFAIEIHFAGTVLASDIVPVCPECGDDMVPQP